MENPDHVKWLLEGVEAWNKRRRDQDFTPSLFAADLPGANLPGANLQRANLQGANLQEAELQGAKLRRANLQGANLQEAELWRADLREANLREANLQEANLQEVELQEADLREAKLQGAKLQGASLREAKLQEADVRSLKSALRIKNVGKADFAFARKLTQDQVNSMKGDTGVLLPFGLVHPDDWPVWEEEDGEVTEQENDVPEAETSPVGADVAESVHKSSSADAEIRDGQLTAIAGPPNAEPRLVDPDELSELFQAIAHGSKHFLRKLDEDNPQVPASLKGDFEEAQIQAQQACGSWYVWENIADAIHGHLDNQYYEDGWHGTDRLARTVVKRVLGLKPLLERVPLKNVYEADEDQKPEATVNEAGLGGLQTIEEQINRLASLPESETHVDQSVFSFLERELETIGSYRAVAEHPEREPSAEDVGRVKRALLRLGGWVVGALKALEKVASPTLANVLTNPSGWDALVANLKRIWDVLARFFGGS